MNADASKHCILAAWQAFASRDPEQVAAVFTEDAEWLAPAENATAVALNGSHHMVGRDALTHFITRQFPALFTRNVHVDFKNLYADGRTAILETRLRATLASGRDYDNDYCFIFELKDGRIHRVREYMDTLRGKQLIFG